ncbi:DUF6382 domain-containing protein [Velocimicrobium porci]|uniref:FHA domain-containing protein n=1 Tax=Velocimicrobium porci TaxID=2606634 RepID=A0A6L5XWL8_9FIRM|nr:DUF6382 domain-containing protein [Velocimicrobium porci]MSS63205.1 FHA domain-containing protein [Velocimicrobium porci]
MEYKKDFHKNYLLLNGKAEEGEHYSMQMILQKAVPYVLPLKVQQLNEEVSYCYDITGLQSIKEFVEKNLLGKQIVKNLFHSILKQVEESKKFLLNEDDFVFTPETIFINYEKQEFYFCYCHNYKKNIKEQIVDVIEYILDYIDYEDKEAVVMVYSLYKISKQEFTYQKFSEILGDSECFCWDRNKEWDKEKREQYQTNEGKKTDQFYSEENGVRTFEQEKSGINEEIKEDSLWQSKEENKEKYPMWVWITFVCSVIICLIILIVAGISGYLFNRETGELYLIKLVILFGAVGVLEVGLLNWILQEKHKIKKLQCESHGEKEQEVYWEEEEETVVLSSTEETEFYLIPINSDLYQEILIEEFPFFIGKIKEKVDARIMAHSISRYHARIDKNTRGFYITDLGSTNGTFINGCRIKPNQSKKIMINDEIALADIKYKFLSK